jgi:protein involved in polysaccharide export with SLBB domain
VAPSASPVPGAPKASTKADIAAEDNTKTPPAAESVKDTSANDTEFQRFVAGATGQSLRLYGYELFAGSAPFAAVQAAPVPAGYILGPGDELVLQVNGLLDATERLIIDRDGRVLVPKVGPLNLAGVPLSDAEKVFTAHIGRVFRNFTVSVTMGRLRSIEIFVVGQARKPGKHLVSSLSSLINALFETGGPNANGSMRAIELRRAGKKLATVDLYAFLARGDNTADIALLAGDIVFIPPASARAAFLGTINAPAIYELRPNETINDILSLSGGLPALAAPQKAQLERLDAKRDIPRYVEDFALDTAGLALPLKAGDILTVFQISQQISNVVTLQGNVAAPLRYTFKPGMRVSSLLSDKRLLIPGSYWLRLNQGASTGNYSRPEVNLDFATIQRLDPVTLRTKTLGFNLLKAMSGDAREDLALSSGDIVTVYGPTDAGPDIEDSITISGEIVGGTKRFVWRQGFTIKDIIPSAQWLVEYYSYWQRPSAQNLRNDINWDYAQITRRIPETLRNQSITFSLGRAVLQGSPGDNIGLLPGDRIALFTTAQMTVPLEKRTQLITLSGEVSIPGQYQISPGETLPELIKRAGGLSQNAFSYGVVFVRESTRLEQQRNLDISLRRMETDINSQTATLLQNVVDTEKASASQAQIAGQRLLLGRLQSLKASGRISLDLDPAQPVLPPIALEDGDTITVPHRPSFVGVFGEVMAETSFIHKASYNAGDYLDKAGLTRDADVDNALLIRADGSVLSNARKASLFSAGLLSTRLNPGDSVFVPAIIDRRTAYSTFIQGAKDWTTILYQFGLGIAALKTIRN